jgi:hypothetical protein
MNSGNMIEKLQEKWPSSLLLLHDNNSSQSGNTETTFLQNSSVTLCDFFLFTKVKKCFQSQWFTGTEKVLDAYEHHYFQS